MSSGSFDYGPAADRARKLLQQRRGKRWRLWLAVFAVLLVPAVAAFVAWTNYRRAEGQAAARAQELGGRVTWSDGESRHVIALSLARSRVQDADLKSFNPWWWHLPHLKDLDLADTGITNAGLEHLRGASIENLILSGTKITADGLQPLNDCLALTSVSFSRTPINDAALERVAGLRRLRSLYLDGTPITNAGLRHLEQLPALQYLRLGENRGVTAEGVASLEAALPELKVSRMEP